MFKRPSIVHYDRSNVLFVPLVDLKIALSISGLVQNWYTGGVDYFKYRFKVCLQTSEGDIFGDKVLLNLPEPVLVRGRFLTFRGVSDFPRRVLTFREGFLTFPGVFWSEGGL